ncbi:MAG TPA: aminotransferase class III-fold pyridoxal phosphate-dependent enzyme [Candidatus Acidoferrum sp.]|jgi:4-aminobutyrate aminotransferase-like enzyme/Ser/Thr protein kinase RdoA (MazF antagonist)
MLLEETVGQPVSEAEATRLAADLYGLAHATAKSLPGEYDDNFHLRAADGREFVLKVMHPARDRSFIDLQCRALEHLAKRTPHLALPRVVPTRTGELFTVADFSDGAGNGSKKLAASRATDSQHAKEPQAAEGSRAEDLQRNDDAQRIVWLLTYLPGKVFAHSRPHSPELLADLGQFLGEMDAALADFSHPAAQRELKWDLARASWIRSHLQHIGGAHRRKLVEHFLDLYESDVAPVIPQLRHSVIYGDANDYNVLVSNEQPQSIAGVVDFGDMHHSVTVAEVAVAAAYAILGKDAVLPAASAVIAGYHGAFPLTEPEIAMLYALIGMRLAVSVTNSAQRASVKPNDSYVTVSEAPAWDALQKWAAIHPRFAHYTFRAACGLAPVPQGIAVEKFLAANASSAASVLDVDLHSAPSLVFDLSVGSAFLPSDLTAASALKFSEKIFAEIKCNAVKVGIGRYDEPRLLYSSPLFAAREKQQATAVPGERRTIHLGVDLFVAPGSSVRAPLDGTVYTFADNAAVLDYGPMVILRHEIKSQSDASTAELSAAARLERGDEFFTLYGHLSKATLSNLRAGQKFPRGEKFAEIGEITENGGWPPHLHFQIIADLLELDKDFPGVAAASQRAIWKSLSPDPNLLLRIPAKRFPAKDLAVAETLALRKKVLGGNLRVSYRQPLKIVRGWMQYLYDETGRAFLDVYNNVPLVGHGHPRVVRAVQEQLALLNTNTRYLHDNTLRCAERLTQLLPQPLRVCYFVNSGSEANELALRMARAHTAREDVMVLRHAYHGNTNTLIDISPYKFNGPGGRGQKPWVHVAPVPDDYRGEYRRGDANAGAKYAQQVADLLAHAKKDDHNIAAFIAETLPSVAGQIVFPKNYLTEAYRHVRAAGGLCIADEVQVGFGRLGTHFWGFETQGVVPDIVVLGKPIGNAFPLAAVITTQEIAASFDNGMEFFSTFGGNPVACAAGLAVLDVLQEEGLQQNALQVGNYLKSALEELQNRHAIIGDARGSGLFLGIDLVRDRESREPAAHQADYIVNRLRDCGILAGTDGPHHNVIKLRPPLIFSMADADVFASALDAILSEDASQPDASWREN